MILKNEIPILEFDTDKTQVINPTHENLDIKLPKKAVFAFLDEQVKINMLQGMYLTVNKYNEHAIDVYKHYGFKIVDSVVTDIGNGFVMDDYIMYKNKE